MKTGRNRGERGTLFPPARSIRFYGKINIMIMGVLLLISCQTGKPVKRLSEDSLMYAMIYDQTGSPVSGVTVYLNDRKTADSDIQGRFMLESMKKDQYKIRLVKQGFEKLEDEFQYIPMQVLYLKMVNSAGLIELAENAMNTNDLVSAENYLNRALAVDPNRFDAIFLKSIVYYLQNRYDAAVEILEQTIKSGNADRSVFRLLNDIRLVPGNVEDPLP